MKSERKYLTALGAWALAFGCSVGWGAFVMPGGTFLPIAGPVGSALGLCIGGAVMLILAVNYGYLMNRFPDSGGTYSYTKTAFGYDHGFLSAWFLILTYVAIIWANATALPLIARTVLGGTFQFGFDYEIAGFHVWFGEIMLAVGSLVLAALICLYRKRAERWQIVMAVVLLGGVVISGALGLCGLRVDLSFGGRGQVRSAALVPDHGSRSHLRGCGLQPAGPACGNSTARRLRRLDGLCRKARHL